MKRANNEGTIRQRPDGRWEGRITVGRNPGTGALMRRSIYGSTQQEVRKAMTEAVKSIDEGVYIQPSKMTAGQWLAIWSRDYLGSIKPRTCDLYRYYIRVHISPSLGAVRLQELTSPMIQAMYNAKQKDGLSPKTIKNMHGVLHKALSQAVKVGYIRYNPSDACELPRCQKPDIHPLEGTQISQFIQAIQGNPYEAIMKVTLFTGLREAEALGLSWDEVDFARGVLRISHQLQRRKLENGFVQYAFAPLKNDKARIIKPAASIMQTLHEQRQEQLKRRVKAGKAWSNPLDLVFTNDRGGHIGANTLYHAFKRVAASIGLPGARYHDLRHTYATMCIQNGDPIKELSEALGHATSAFTMDVYGHVTDDMRQASADRMEAFIKRLI